MIKLREMNKIREATVKNANEKVFGARIENAENILKKNKMPLWQLHRYMVGDSQLMI